MATDGDIKDRISSLLRVIQITKLVKEDSIPCQIEEVFKPETVLIFFSEVT